MLQLWWWIPLGLAVAAVAFLLLWLLLGIGGRARFARARKDFHKQREWLEARFLRVAAEHLKPDAPRWTDCDFDDSVSYVRNRSTGELSAFVAVTVALEGVSHPPMSAAELIGNFRPGTAVFRFDRNHWETDGVVFLDLSPSEAIRFYQKDIEVVGRESAARQADGGIGD